MHDDTVSELISQPRPESSLGAALSYIRRGWPVLILHHLTELGHCSCGDTSENHSDGSAGKHPVASQWRAAAILDETVMVSVLAGRPAMNLGILTGQRAGVWVLDVDPRHDGDKRLIELENEHGKLPYTYTVRTGSGGSHYYWLLPDDFTPTNSSKRLPVGLDVRGEGGQVVAPPSVSHAGGYEVLLNLPLVQAPDWLLDLIRPAMPSGEATANTALVGDFGAGLGAFTTGLVPNARLISYAVSAVNDELRRLRDAVPGTRNNTAFEVACSLIEFINSPWAQLDGPQAWAAYLLAAEHAGAHGGFDQAEAIACWQSALRKIGTRGRAVPDAVPGGVVVGWDLLGGVPPFSPSGASPQPVDNPVDKKSQESSHPVPLSPTTMGEQGVSVGLAWDTVGHHQQASISFNDPVDALISNFLTVAQLGQLPPPSWLIDGWLVRDSAAWIIGKPGEGKSFAALSMALCVATGRPWYGQQVRQGAVGYVVAEGAGGMNKRVQAWQKTFYDGTEVTDIGFLPMPVQVTDFAAWDLLIAAAVRMRLTMIVLDTQARVTMGMDENSAKEVGLLVEQVERLRRATGACVLVVHHTPKNGSSPRGSGAIEGAAQTMLHVGRTADQVSVAVVKQKDDEPPSPMLLRLASVQVGLVPSAAGAGEAWVTTADKIIYGGVLQAVSPESHLGLLKTKAMQDVARVLIEYFPGRGALKSEAWNVAQSQTKMPKSSFYRAWDQLESDGMLAAVIIEDRPTQRRLFKLPAPSIDALSGNDTLS